MGQILNLTISAGAVVPLRLDGGSRTVIRCDGNDVRIAYDNSSLSKTVKRSSSTRIRFRERPLTNSVIDYMRPFRRVLMLQFRYGFKDRLRGLKPHASTKDHAL